MLDPATHQPANSVHLPNRIGSSIHGYSRWEDRRTSGFWAPKQVDDDDATGVCSPPLWKTSPTRSPQHDKNHHQSLSPSSRTRAIARGQRELMEMVRNMPESTYELTLKDLVEKPTVEEDEENEKEEGNLLKKNAYKREGSGSSSSRRVDQRPQEMRSGNVQSGGLYLKMMMFPPSLGSRKKKKKTKKSESSGNDGSKASLRPSMSEESLKGVVDKEWWKKSPSGSSGNSESVATSINSGSAKSSGSSSGSCSRSSSRKERGGGSCWFLIGKPKRLSRE
ncbi:uncharacterized protein LOC129294674 [Prosopis cineraria]|uniref:uncharacterized protein LOC129294674 n=1 Tax=Prosopis cineraria TaxID=364024 RepID=UPI00240FE9E3|nr:uncharacterized protein LOC129294674 [Prosopis cineraria]